MRAPNFLLGGWELEAALASSPARPRRPSLPGSAPASLRSSPLPGTRGRDLGGQQEEGKQMTFRDQKDAGL